MEQQTALTESGSGVQVGHFRPAVRAWGDEESFGPRKDSGRRAWGQACLPWPGHGLPASGGTNPFFWKVLEKVGWETWLRIRGGVTIKVPSWKTRSWRRRESATMLTSQQLTRRWRANMRKGWVMPQSLKNSQQKLAFSFCSKAFFSHISYIIPWSKSSTVKDTCLFKVCWKKEKKINIFGFHLRN